MFHLCPAFPLLPVLSYFDSLLICCRICRGGGEYGREWRDAGSLGNKQNVFDDFQACAEHLIKKGYCTSQTLTTEVLNCCTLLRLLSTQSKLPL